MASPASVRDRIGQHSQNSDGQSSRLPCRIILQRLHHEQNEGSLKRKELLTPRYGFDSIRRIVRLPSVFHTVLLFYSASRRDTQNDNFPNIGQIRIRSTSTPLYQNHRKENQTIGEDRHIRSKKGLQNHSIVKKLQDNGKQQ